MKIVNYLIREKMEMRFEPFPKLVLRWGWLARLINWILRLLNAQSEVPFTTTSRIQVDVDDIRRRIYTIERELVRNGEKRPTMLIMGPSQYQQLVKCPTLYHMQTLDLEQFCGLKVILNPYIDGLVVV